MNFTDHNSDNKIKKIQSSYRRYRYRKKKKEFDKILKEYEVLKKIIDNIENDINKVLIEKLLDTDNIIRPWLEKISNNYFTQYICDTSEDKKNNLYLASAKLMPIELRKIFTKKYMFRSYAQAILDDKIDKNLNKNLRGLIDRFRKNYHYIEIDNKSISEEMIVSDLEGINNIMKKLENDLLNEEIVTRYMLFGKLGIGKSTLISIIEGYLCTINNKVPNERVISRNNRGTIEIDSTEVQVGNLTTIWEDTIGLGDPGEKYSQEKVWKMFQDHWDNILNNTGNIDGFLYGINGNCPRLDTTDYSILKNYISTFKKNPNYEESIDYWLNTILTITQMNDVIPDTYGHKIPFQKYEPKKYWTKEKKIPIKKYQKNMFEYITKYNEEVYKNQLVKDITIWKNYVEERLNKKIYETNENSENEGQSFFYYFKKAVNEVYNKDSIVISEEKINYILKNIKVVLTGTATKDSDLPIWDYRNSIIDPLPNFQDKIPQMFSCDIDDIIKSNTISENWFNELMNQIHCNTKSDKYKLLLTRANNLNQNSTSNVVEDIGDEDLNINRNNNVNFNQEASNQTRLAASRQVDNISDEEIQENIFIRGLKAIGNAIKGAFNWFASFFW